MTWLTFVFAQTTTAAPTTQPAPPAPGLESMLFPLFLIMLVMYFLMIRPQSRERKKREQMLSTVKKNDRVVTVGGIIGTVLTVRDDEITLKIDESNNTKVTLLRSAVQRVLSAAPGEGPDAGSKP